MAAVRYTTDGGGVVVTVEVTEAVADAIGRLDRSEARKERKRKRHERCFSDLRGRDGRDGGLDAEVLLDSELRPASRRVVTTPLSGPRYECTLVMGVTLVTGWTPLIESSRPCPVCGGKTLPPSCACLACLRTSYDAVLPRLTAAERAAYERAARATKRGGGDGLSGGRGKARPKAKAAKGRGR